VLSCNKKIKLIDSEQVPWGKDEKEPWKGCEELENPKTFFYDKKNWQNLPFV